MVFLVRLIGCKRSVIHFFCTFGSVSVEQNNVIITIWY